MVDAWASVSMAVAGRVKLRERRGLRADERRLSVRQNRVGLASDADVKLAEATSTRPGSIRRQSAGDGDKKEIRRRGEHDIRRKAIT